MNLFLFFFPILIVNEDAKLKVKKKMENVHGLCMQKSLILFYTSKSYIYIY